MGGMPPNSNPGVIASGQSQTINPMFINPNQRTFQSFNPNLPSNMYGNVTTGRSDYQNSPYFISPEGTTTSVGNTSGGSVYSPETITGTPTAPTDGTVYTSTDFAGNEVPYTIVTPTAVRPPGYIDNTPSTFPEQRQYYDSSPMLPGGPAVMHSSDGTSTNLGYNLGPSVAGGRGNIVPGQTTVPSAPATTLTDKFLQSITGPVKENKVTSYSHATDNDKPAGPGDSGYDQARKLEALQNGGTGIIYKDDRREVYLDGVLIGNPKSADSADKMLAKAQAEKSGSVSTQDNTNTSGGK